MRVVACATERASLRSQLRDWSKAHGDVFSRTIHRREAVNFAGFQNAAFITHAIEIVISNQ